MNRKRDDTVKIGLFGGTFDPIHSGHLLIAELAKKKVGLDQVWFIPAANPPHKLDRQVTSAHHRVEMIKLAIAKKPYFHLSMVELERSGLSYTVETLQILTRAYPMAQFYLIVGADMVKDLPNWYKIEKIIQTVEIVGVYRPHVYVKNIPEWLADRLIWIEEEISIHVSSSYIRRHIVCHDLLQHVIPVSILRYIEENHLYEY